MKKTINIFVAGAKDLKNERNALKALAHDINIKLKKNVINTTTYYNYKDNQEEYNKVIKRESDIVIILFKGEIGEYTEIELKTAAEAYKEKKKPEIFIFFNKDKAEASKIKKIESLLQKYLGDGSFYIEYRSTEELKTEARKRIVDYITPIIYTNNKIRRWLKLLSVCALLFAGFITWKYVNNNANPNLLFVGGGSALNFIKENKNIDISNYPNSIYASMPSSIAQSMLGEEFNRSKDNYNFVTICLSSEKAKISQLLKHCNEKDFSANYNIVECYLGEDTMMVFVQNNFFYNHPDLIKENQTTITPKQLYKLIKEPDLNADFYCTNRQSGTRDYYNMWLLKEQNDSTIKDMSEINSNIDIFNERDGEWNLIKNNSSYIIMGSKCYYPKNLDKSISKDKRYKALMLVDDNNSKKPISKDIYMYFIAKIENDKIIIPNTIYNLLNKIDITKEIINTNALLKLKRMNKANTLQQLNKREDYIKEK